jgi:hypothetical protein
MANQHGLERFHLADLLIKIIHLKAQMMQATALSLERRDRRLGTQGLN